MQEEMKKESTMEMPLLPLKDIVIFPHMIVPVFIHEDLCINAVEEAEANGRKIFLSAFSVSDAGEELKCSLQPPFDVFDVGTVCSIMKTRKLPDGRLKVSVQGLHRAVVKGLTRTEGFPSVEVEELQETEYANATAEMEATIRAVKENLEKVVGLGKDLSPNILMIFEDIKDPGRLADLVSANLGLKVHEAQMMLDIVDPVARLDKVNGFLSREIEVLQMQVRIQSQAKEEINKMQREHYLREQIRVLRNELGDNDSKDEVEAMWEKVKDVPLSEEALEEVSRQIRRLERMHQDSSEAALTRTHVDTLLALPWGKKSDDNLDLKAVVDTLDEDHYGLDLVKDRIIEYLAVKKLNPEAKSPIICFVGPPGVGKTSLGRSIAKSLGRTFSRISLGGVRDEADIRGHRKTYVGAFPGRVIQSIKQAETCNPLIMLDEIDKLGSDHRGDPSSALLEVLDPEQNNKFVDHYLGVAFDLSDVMFIANANSLDTIPAPLRDRLEIIEVSGYSEEEKEAIANQYLIPKQMKESGVEKYGVSFTKYSVYEIIRGYTRESGLRNLEKQVASVCRKIARQFAENEEEAKKKTFKVTPAMVKKFLGVKKYDDSFFHLEPTVGVSLGMAYTQFGGEILAIETNLLPTGNHKLVLTGKLGDVMKESAQTAMSFIRSRAADLGLDQEVLDKNELHVHVPQGAVPKDGPSAGTAIATSILSALLGAAPAEKTCMTGEITLHGKVLPIGGLKEKVLAAQREGLGQVVLPEANKANYIALPANAKKAVKAVFVKDYMEVFQTLFPEHAEKAGHSDLQVVGDTGTGSPSLAG